MSWILVAAAYVAAFQPWLPIDLQTPVLSLAYGVPPMCHLVVPMVGGFLVERVGGVVGAGAETT